MWLPIRGTSDMTEVTHFSQCVHDQQRRLEAEDCDSIRCAQLISGGRRRIRPPCTVSRSRSPHNVLHSSSYYACEQTGFRRSTALFSSSRSRLTSRISPWCTTLVWSTHGLVSAFFHVGRQFGTSRPNTLACGLRKRPWSFLMGVTIVTPNTCYTHT